MNCSGLHCATLAGELDDQHGVHAGAVEQAGAGLDRGQGRRRVLGSEHRHRVRVEGHRDDRVDPEPGSGVARLAEDVRVPEVDPVEVADAHHGAAEVGRHVLDVTPDLHGGSLATPGGRGVRASRPLPAAPALGRRREAPRRTCCSAQLDGADHAHQRRAACRPCWRRARSTAARRCPPAACSSKARSCPGLMTALSTDMLKSTGGLPFLGHRGNSLTSASVAPLFIFARTTKWFLERAVLEGQRALARDRLRACWPTSRHGPP